MPFWKRDKKDEAPTESSASRADKLWAQGSVALHNKAHKRALKLMREAMKLEPSRLDGRLNLGAALLFLNQPEEAITHFRYVLALDAQNTMALLNLAACLDKIGDLDGSVATLQKLVQQRPAWRDAHYNLAVALYKQDRFDEAGEALQKELKLNPEHSLARDMMNEIHLKPRPKKTQNVNDEGTSSTQTEV
jgi:tetratricopeptide (TPR) repeat protein